MHTFVAQDIVTIQGGTNTALTQGRNAWLDLAGYQDVVAWLQVFSFTASTLTMSYQTAPTDLEDSFTVMSGPATTMPFSVATGVTTTPLFKEALTVPLARYFRWQLAGTTSGGLWEVTFRLFLSGNTLRQRKKAKAQASQSS